MLNKVDFRIGLVVNNLGPSQLAYYALKSANKYASKLDISIFYETLTVSCIETRSALLSINEIWNYGGNLIATDIETALKVKKATIPAKKIFYVYDVEWMRNKTDFMYNIEAFSNIKLVARSKEHAKIIEKYSNQTVSGIIPDFDLWKITLC